MKNLPGSWFDMIDEDTGVRSLSDKSFGDCMEPWVFFMVTPKDFIPAMPEDSIQELKLATKFTGAAAGRQKVWYL